MREIDCSMRRKVVAVVIALCLIRVVVGGCVQKPELNFNDDAYKYSIVTRPREQFPTFPGLYGPSFEYLVEDYTLIEDYIQGVDVITFHEFYFTELDNRSGNVPWVYSGATETIHMCDVISIRMKGKSGVWQLIDADSRKFLVRG